MGGELFGFDSKRISGLGGQGRSNRHQRVVINEADAVPFCDLLRVEWTCQWRPYGIGYGGLSITSLLSSTALA